MVNKFLIPSTRPRSRCYWREAHGGLLAADDDDLLASLGAVDQRRKLRLGLVNGRTASDRTARSRSASPAPPGSQGEPDPPGAGCSWWTPSASCGWSAGSPSRPWC